MEKYFDSSKTVNRDQAFSILGQISQALSSPVRLRLIQILGNKSCSVEELSQRLNASVGNTSQHLQKLKDAKMVRVTQKGVVRTYSLSSPLILEAFLSLQKFAISIGPELEEITREICPEDLLSKCSLAEILQEVREKKGILIDVRDFSEFQYSHAPSAHFFSRDNISANLAQLSKKKKVYAYCRGHFCSLANDVVCELRKKGFKAYRMTETVHEIIRAIEQEGA